MKLQVNNSGAWKNVLTFGIEHIEHVKLATMELAGVAIDAGEPVAWRIVDATGTVVAVNNRKSLCWNTPPWMRGREIVA